MPSYTNKITINRNIKNVFKHLNSKEIIQLFINDSINSDEYIEFDEIYFKVPIKKGNKYSANMKIEDVICKYHFEIINYLPDKLTETLGYIEPIEVLSEEPEEELELYKKYFDKYFGNIHNMIFFQEINSYNTLVISTTTFNTNSKLLSVYMFFAMFYYKYKDAKLYKQIKYDMENK